MKFLSTLILPACFAASSVVAGVTDHKAVAPAPERDSWEYRLSMPAWGFWITGENTLHGKSASIDLGPGTIIPRIDMAADVRFEANRGRFSIFSEFIYMSLSDGAAATGVVKKLDAQIDQTMAELGVGWRIIDSPKGFVEITGGVRYTNFYQQLTLQPNDQEIDRVSTRLARAGTALNAARALRTLEGRDPSVPVAPLLGEKGEAAALAVRRVKGSTAARKERISNILEGALDREVSRRDEWWDPFVGVKARYNLNDRCYVSAKADIGGFGVGSELTWQAEAAFGMMMTKSIYSELGYRALGVDYQDGGLEMDTVTHGLQLTLGMQF